MTTIRTLVVAYLVLQFGLGVFVYLRRRAKGSADYVVARGSLGMFVLGGTIAATQLSSATALGDVAWTAAYGIGYYFLVWPFLWLGYWISAKWVARKMHAFGERAGGITIPDLLAARYDSQRLVRGIAAGILLIGFLFDFGVQFRAAGLVMGDLFGMKQVLAVIIAAVVFLGYTYLGGLLSIAYNDVIQICLFVVAYVVGAFFAVHSAGGVSSISAALQKQDASLLNLFGSHGLGFWTLIGLGISITLQFISYPVDTMKFYSAKNRRHLLSGIGIAFVFQGVIAFAVIAIGLAGRALHPRWTVDQFDNLVPTFALTSFPPLLGGLVMAIVIGAVMAVSSSILLTLGSALINDLYIPLAKPHMPPEKRLGATRIGVLIIGAAGTLFSFVNLGAIATVINNVLQVLAASFAVTLLFGMSSRKPNRLGAVLSMVGGAAGVALWILLGSPWGLAPSLPGFALSILGMIIGIRLGHPVPEPNLHAFFPSSQATVNTQMAATEGALGED